MTWWLAPSLDKLGQEIDARWPKRNKASDGTRGDGRHAAKKSDHNPDPTSKPPGIVRARDITHDPVRGVDCNEFVPWLIERCRRGVETRVWYVIWNGQIWSRTTDWRPRPEEGHEHHAHISIRRTPAAEGDVSPWLEEQEEADMDPSALGPVVFTNAEAAVKSREDDIAWATWNRFSVTTPQGQEIKLVNALELILLNQEEISRRLAVLEDRLSPPDTRAGKG